MNQNDLSIHRISIAEEKYRAILALERVDFSKHAGVISYFQKNYVKEKYLAMLIPTL